MRLQVMNSPRHSAGKSIVCRWVLHKSCKSADIVKICRRTGLLVVDLSEEKPSVSDCLRKWDNSTVAVQRFDAHGRGTNNTEPMRCSQYKKSTDSRKWQAVVDSWWTENLGFAERNSMHHAAHTIEITPNLHSSFRFSVSSKRAGVQS